MKTKIRKNHISETSGFTLIEVMVSVALTVVLLLGVNFIFSTSSAAVRAGEALASATREQRGAQTKLFADLNDVAKDAPFIISMRTRIQYLNADDALTSTAPDQIAIDNNGNFTTVNPVIYGKRSHRVDVLEFCAHQFYERRTSDNNSFNSYTFGDDVWVQIGHGNLPANDLSAFYGPDDVSAPSTTPPSVLGAYAADWVLNRTVMLFKAPSNVPINPITSNLPNGTYVATPEEYYSQSVPPNVTLGGSTFQPYLANLSPLSWGNYSSYQSSQFGDSRFDIAGVTLEEFKQICSYWAKVTNSAAYSSSLTTTPPNSRFPLWCAPLMYHSPVSTIWDPVVTALPVPANPILNTPAYSAQWSWVRTLTGDGRRPLMNRFNIDPTIQTEQTSASIAEMTPFLIQHCSQFIVEYAGDYLSQVNDPGQGDDGLITANGSQPDGVVDYYTDTNRARHIRWYGLPRKTTQDPTTGIRGYFAGDSVNNINNYRDVIPLSDYLTLINGPPANANRRLAPFEVECNFDPRADYAGAGSTFIGNNYDNKDDSRYAVAWYNNTPTMIRILIKVDDPNNSLKDGPWYEYIFHLK